MDNMPLADLKKAIKEFKQTQTPKLSSKKSDLMNYARLVGIVKSTEKPLSSEPPKDYSGNVVKLEKKKVVELPEELKAPKAEAKVEKAKGKKAPLPPSPPPEKAGKKASPFAAFMAANKGQGRTMSELAALYKANK